MTEENTETEQKVVETTAEEVKQDKSPREPVIRDSNDAIKQLRKENEKLRKSLDETSAVRAEELANKKLESLRQEVEEKANTSAKELLEARLSEIEAASRGRLAKAELRNHAVKAGVADFDDLYEVMKKSTLSKVSFTDDGDVANAAELIAELKASKPHFFAGVSTSSNAKAPDDRLDTTVDFRKLPEADADAVLRKMGLRV